MITEQERIFLKRAALKMAADQSLTAIEAMRAVCADDQRIVETFVTMPDRDRKAFVAALSDYVYHTIRKSHGA